ncbi:hypothetical protein KJ611_04680 [Patescibacteria group bacterium]|nr:hypothetical protein [Patescibacteria group bacterium]
MDFEKKRFEKGRKNFSRTREGYFAEKDEEEFNREYRGHESWEEDENHDGGDDYFEDY